MEAPAKLEGERKYRAMVGSIPLAAHSLLIVKVAFLVITLHSLEIISVLREKPSRTFHLDAQKQSQPPSVHLFRSAHYYPCRAHVLQLFVHLIPRVHRSAGGSSEVRQGLCGVSGGGRGIADSAGRALSRSLRVGGRGQWIAVRR